MLDESVCILCGKPVSSTAAYCSQECSTIDSSSSTSASASVASSAHPSPIMLPVDNDHHADVPPLIPSSRHRTTQSVSSSSIADSEDFADSGFNFVRRPSATNQRTTVATLLPWEHRRPSASSSIVSPSDERYAYLYEHAVSDVLARKITSPFPDFRRASTFTSSASSVVSSDEEASAPDHPSFNQATITNRTTGLLTRPPLHKKEHRASLPAYFSRLTIASSPTVGLSSANAHNGGEPSSMSDYETPIQAQQKRPIFPLRTSTDSSGSKTASIGTKDSRGLETTPVARGRTRDRQIVRHGGSRSPRGVVRSRRSRSPNRGDSSSPEQGYPVRRGRDIAPKLIPNAGEAAVSGQRRGRHSLGERAVRATSPFVSCTSWAEGIKR